jgi:hypothetical protein
MTVDNMTESMKKEQAAGWDYSVLINNPILPSVFKIVK